MASSSRRMEEGARPASELVGEWQAASNLSRNEALPSRGISGAGSLVVEGELGPELYGEYGERVLTVKVGLC